MTYAPEATSDDAARPDSKGARRTLGCLLEIVETLVLTLVIYLSITRRDATETKVGNLAA